MIRKRRFGTGLFVPFSFDFGTHGLWSACCSPSKYPQSYCTSNEIMHWSMDSEAWGNRFWELQWPHFGFTRGIGKSILGIQVARLRVHLRRGEIDFGNSSGRISGSPEAWGSVLGIQVARFRGISFYVMFRKLLHRCEPTENFRLCFVGAQSTS